MPQVEKCILVLLAAVHPTLSQQKAFRHTVRRGSVEKALDAHPESKVDNQ
jgi:hypothetical protein